MLKSVLAGPITVAGPEMRRVTAILFALPIAAALCPQGAVQGTRPEDCYLYGASQSWQKTEAFCASNKGHLSSLPNALVNAFIASYLKPLDSAQSYWLGAELKSAADKWTWTDGSSFTYTMWAAGKWYSVATFEQMCVFPTPETLVF